MTRTDLAFRSEHVIFDFISKPFNRFLPPSRYGALTTLFFVYASTLAAKTAVQLSAWLSRLQRCSGSTQHTAK